MLARRAFLRVLIVGAMAPLAFSLHAAAPSLMLADVYRSGISLDDYHYSAR